MTGACSKLVRSLVQATGSHLLGEQQLHHAQEGYIERFEAFALSLGVEEIGVTAMRSFEMKLSLVSLTTGRSGSSPALLTSSP